jgi:hypothetical protein
MDTTPIGSGPHGQLDEGKREGRGAMASPLPPRYVNVPVELLYHADLPASLLRTALRIYGLSWRRGYQRTEPIGFDKLREICGVGRSTLYGHLATLSA